MKLQELAVVSPTKQAAKVFESYFGNSVPFEQLSKRQAQHMLNRVRGLINEHRRQPAFHKSEQNPAYLKLVVMEQGLASKLREEMPVAPGSAPASGGVAAAPAQNPQQAQAAMALQQQQNKKQIQDQIKAKQKELQDLQKQLTMPMSETRRRRIAESEVQQAQVVLASQDMVDQVQKMIEQVTSMQFKDLPALVDQVKNQVGVDQAMSFNQEVTGALTGLTQNLQGSKQQLEGALGVVTGQAPTVPGEDMGAEPAPELGAELPPPPEGEEEIDVDMDADIAEPAGGAADLGRARR
jgi:DNA anti-recombination protein RmuC